MRYSDPLPNRAPAAASAAAARKAVLLDKDGTLVVDVPYSVDPAKLCFTANALAAMQRLDRAGYALVVVTNQPGIATGRFSRGDFIALQKALTQRIRDEAGVELTGFMTCPHAPDASGAPACLCRKPAAGLLRQASLAHRLDLQRSWMVGDILNDIEAGRRAGCRTILLDVGNETEWRTSPLRTPHHRAADLLEAAQIILQSDAAPAAALAVAQRQEA